MIWTALSFIFSILFFYYHNYFFILIILGFNTISYKRNRKSIFLCSQLMLFFFCLLRFTYFNVPNVENNNFEFVVIEKYNNYVILEKDDIKCLYYDDSLEEGNKILLEGKINKLDSNNEFYKYLLTQRVNFVFEGEVVENDNHITFNNRVINFLLNNKDEGNKNILKLILFNEKNDSNEIFYEYFDKLSISFLVVISGFHINLIFKILKKTKILKYIITFFYVYLLNFSISSLKAFLYYVIKKVNRKGNYPINNSDILSLLVIAFLFINPSYIFNMGFIYSFAFSYIINFVNNILIGKKTSIKILKKVIIYCFSIPIILQNNYEISTNSFFANVLLVYPISFMFVFSLIYLFFDKFYLVYKIYALIMEKVLYAFAKYSINLIFGKPSLFIIILMYASLILFLYFYQNRLYKKALFYFAIFVFINIFQYNIPNLDYKESVYFIDVGQGDCIALKIKNSKKVVLIDTGGNKYKNLAKTTIIPFLKSEGIKEIETIIITHDDYDHNGNKDNLLNGFKVNNVIEDSSIESVTIGDKNFVNLNVNENRDNDGSIVLYGEYGGVNYLFTGDISSKKEEEIINEYKNLSVDILKVSHHGSSSSTSENFLRHINAKIALIGVSKNNSYDHPSSEVISRLEKYKLIIYRTDIDGTIHIYKSLFNNGIIVEK